MDSLIHTIWENRTSRLLITAIAALEFDILTADILVLFDDCERSWIPVAGTGGWYFFLASERDLF